jgi:hypothetical protein
VIGAWHGAIGPEGVAEALIVPKAAMERAVDLTARRGNVPLAAGHIAFRRADKPFATLGVVAGHTRGDVSIRVDALRGRLAAQFHDGLRVTAETPSGPRPEAIEIELSAPGAKIAPDRVRLVEQTSAIIDVTPLAHDVELTVSARAKDGRTGHWEGALPIVPGAIWIDPRPAADSPPTISIASPVERRFGFLSLVSDRGRVFGAVVPLSQRSDGFFRGEVTPALSGSPRILYAIVSGDPLEQGIGTTAWPLRPAEGAMPLHRLGVLIDGLPFAEGRETARARAARTAGIAVIIAAAIAQVLILLAHNRARERELDAHFARAATSAISRMREAEGGESASEPKEPSGTPDDRAEEARMRQMLMPSGASNFLRFAVFAALIALAFAMVAALATFR